MKNLAQTKVSASTRTDRIDAVHGRASSFRPAAWELLVLAIVIGAMVSSVIRQLAVQQLLGHDESVYAVRAQTWLADRPSWSWSAHRAAGLPVIGMAVLSVAESPTALRGVSLLFAVALVLGVWILSRRLGGPVGASVAAATVAFMPPLLEHAARFLTDLPATALVVWLLIVVGREVERPQGPGPGLLWAGPLVAGAVWLRFGAALPVALVAASAVLLWPRTIVRSWRWVLGSVMLACLLLWFHLAGAVEEFGTPWGRILYTSRLTRAERPGAALLTYLGELPGELAGVPAAVVMGLGFLGVPLVLASVALRNRRGGRSWTDRWDTGSSPRQLLLSFLVALAHFVAMGLSSAAEARFVFPSLVVMTALGGVTISVLTSRLRSGTAAAVAAVATLAVMAVGVGPTTGNLVQSLASADERYDAMRRVAAAVSRDSGGDCVVMTSYIPQMEWLTDCAAVPFGESRPIDGFDEAPEGVRYVVLFRDGKRQPSGEAADDLLARTRLLGSWDVADGTVGAAELYRVVDP